MTTADIHRRRYHGILNYITIGLQLFDDSSGKLVDLQNDIDSLYERLHKGITVEKISRKGKLREIKIKLARNNYFLHWKSQILSLKLGKTNKSEDNLSHFLEYNIIYFIFKLSYVSYSYSYTDNILSA